MRKSRLWTIITLLVIVAVAIAAVAAHSGKTKSTTMDMATAAVSTNTITIQNYMFSPMAIKVKVGTKVTWTNKDAVNHTITADNPSNDAPNSMDIAQGKSYSFTFTKAGTYMYHCFPHPYMHGTIEVTN